MLSNDIILKAENISKQYRLGQVGTGTLSHDLNRWWHKMRGKENPYLKIGEVNNRSEKGESDYVWALQDINFEVERGEVLGIIGKNGAGKSTLLKILSRVTAPTTGSIKTKGRIASLLEVGTGFHGEMTGRENIYLNGAILGMTKKEITSKIDEIIEFSGCERYIDSPVKRYSSGMTVRLAFAVAAFLEPEILVVDEVLAVGDAEFQKKAIGKMQDISRQGGRTVLFVSHDMTAIEALSHKVIILNNGVSSKKLNPQDAIAAYLNSNKETSLNFKKRTGDGSIIIDKIIVNSQENAINQIKSGERLSMRFLLNKKIPLSEKGTVSFYVVFKNELNNPVFTISNRYHPIEEGSDDGFFSEFSCVLPSFNLVEGVYKATTWMSYKNGFCDQIEDAFIVDVISTDFFGTSQIPNGRKHGLLLINQIWNVE